MEFDRLLFKSFQPGDRPVLRLFGFETPTFTLGRLASRRMDLSRLPYPHEVRPTGGWSVLHGPGDLCYSVTASAKDPLVGGDLLTSYRKISEILAAGLRALGRATELSEEKHRAAGPAHCFSAPSKCELTLGGRKVAGGAQAREGGVFLQQGVILLTVAPEWSEAFPEETTGSMTGLNDLPGVRPVGRDDLERSLVQAFEGAGASFEKNLTLDLPSLKLGLPPSTGERRTP